MKFSAAAVLAAAAGASAYSNVTYTTEIVTAVTTYCPYATQVTYGGTTYTITEVSYQVERYTDISSLSPCTPGHRRNGKVFLSAAARVRGYRDGSRDAHEKYRVMLTSRPLGHHPHHHRLPLHHHPPGDHHFVSDLQHLVCP